MSNVSKYLTVILLLAISPIFCPQNIFETRQIFNDNIRGPKSILNFFKEVEIIFTTGFRMQTWVRVKD